MRYEEGPKDLLADDCRILKHLDKTYGTPRDSPLHHDNRCIKCTQQTTSQESE